jgi:2-dehydro-3-deoxyphosphogalactonate aldolase
MGRRDDRMSAAFPGLRRSLVAILRGLRPDEAKAAGAALFAAGIEAIEVPLNSPEPFRSIEVLAETMPPAALVGAGTVLAPSDVDRLHAAGGRLLVSPNVDAAVLERAAAFGMVTMPGVFTATEALLALAVGASALKFFPASVLGPGGIAAIRAVLPAGTVAGAVGGISERDFAAYAKAGIRTFGLGSSLYTSGLDASSLGQRATAAVRAWDSVFAGPDG